MVSSTTIFNTSAEAVADTNKTNPTSALSKCEILSEIGSGGAFCASVSLRQRIGSIVSQIQPKSPQNSVARARSPPNSLNRPIPDTPLTRRKLPPRRAVQRFLLIQSEHSDRTDGENRLLIRENILFETRHIKFVLALVKPEQRRIPHSLGYSFNNHSFIRALRTNYASGISIQVPCLTRL